MCFCRTFQEQKNKMALTSMLAVKLNILSKQAKCTVNADNQYNAMSLIRESWSIKTVGVNGTLLDMSVPIVHLRASCHVLLLLLFLSILLSQISKNINWHI